MMNISVHFERNEQHALHIGTTCVGFFKHGDNGFFHGEHSDCVSLLYL
jgi:hypothetical protein